MEQRGKGPSNGNWKSFPKCPFCGKDGGGVFLGKFGGDLFKCFHSSCPTGNVAMDEVGFLVIELGLSRKDAAITYLKESGVWKEREAYAPSVMPGKGARKNKLPSDTDNLGK